MIIYGVNPVLEALRAGRVKEVRVGGRGGGRVPEVVTLAGQQGVRVRRVPEEALERDSLRGVHQGVVADLEAASNYSLDELVLGAEGPPLLVVLDGIEDPHNLGAILRTADAAGVHGLVRQTRRAAALGGAAAKASAGAVVHVKIADVVNVARALEDLKALGVWTVGFVAEAPTRYDAIDFTGPAAIVLGGESEGLRRLVRERCDFLAAIPMRGRVNSLNVSVAAGVALFEAVRQRAAAGSGARLPKSGPE